MTKRKSKKEKITESVFNEIPKDINPYINTTTDRLLFEWWFTGRHGTGLRLTEEGLKAFKLADLEYYDIKFNPLQWKSVYDLILELNQKINCPYYVHILTLPPYYIRLFDSKIAMMVNLYGNLKEYLDSIY